MKRTLLLLCMALGATAVPVAAKEITPDQAMAIAAQKLPSEGVASTMSTSPDLTLKASIKTDSGANALYLFDSPSSATYMIVAADDNVADPLLGYGQYMSADSADTPPALQYWLQEYANQIEWLREHPSQGTISASAIALQSSLPDEVKPLLGEMAWNQSAPYYNDCPIENGKHCVTGCVATSLAQAMRYYQYPSKGTGAWSYTWNGQTLTATFASSTYDWDNMPIHYFANSTATQNAAVAKLMSDLGISVSMDYGTSSSGAMTQACVYALTQNFGYDKSLRMLERSFYGVELWEETIRAELAAGRPVVYAGQSNEGGHQFVCDGYNADGYFHFNWGWGGECNGWFLTTSLVPEGVGIGGYAAGYNYNQSILAGMRPDQGSSSSEGMAMFGSGLTATDGKNYSVAFEGYTFISGSVTMDLGYTVLDTPAAEADQSRIHKVLTKTVTPSIPSRASGQIYASLFKGGTTTFDPVEEFSLADGTYYVAPTYKPSTSDTWQVLPCGKRQWIKINVSGGEATVAPTEGTTVTVTDIDVPEEIMPGRTVTVSGELRVEGSEFYDPVTFIVKSAAGDTITTAGNQLIDLAAGTSGPFTLKLVIPVGTAPGTYNGYMVINGSEVDTPVDVEVVSGSLTLDAANVPDAKLRSLLSGFDTNSDGTLSDTELARIGIFNAQNKGITNAQGIQYLYKCTQLYLNGNEIPEIDLSPLTVLSHVELNDNLLTELDVSNNHHLYYLYVANNMVTSLNLTNQTMIHTLDVSGNPLPALSLFDNGAMGTFTAGSHISVGIDGSRTVDLDQYPQLDPSCIHNLSGATLDGSLLRFNDNTDTANYDYDTGNSVVPYMPVTMVALNSTGVDGVDQAPIASYTIDGLNIDIRGDFSTVTIADPAGRIICQGSRSQYSLPHPGIYLMRIDDKVSKLSVR